MPSHFKLGQIFADPTSGTGFVKVVSIQGEVGCRFLGHRGRFDGTWWDFEIRPFDMNSQRTVESPRGVPTSYLEGLVTE